MLYEIILEIAGPEIKCALEVRRTFLCLCKTLLEAGYSFLIIKSFKSAKCNHKA